MRSAAARRSAPISSPATIAITIATALIAFAAAPPARADSVATLLGDYSISQLVRLDVAADAVRIHYVVDMAALPALNALRKADANGDGSTSTQERDAYLRTLLPEFTENLHLEVDGHALALQALGLTSTLPTEQSGFSLRVDSDFRAPIEIGDGAAHRLSLRNDNFAGKFGWHEAVVVAGAGAGVSIYDSDAFSTSATAYLNANPESLPPGGPLDERRVDMQATTGALPATASPLKPRPDHPPGSALAGNPDSAGAMSNPPKAGDDRRSYIARSSDRLVALISAPHLSPLTMITALLVALFLGALHAFSPGHGKSVVGAYLIGSRGTPWHAAFLGLTVTITHTLGVFALGLATMFASSFFSPERVFPILTFLSGLLVLIIGTTMLVRRWRQLREDGSEYRAFAVGETATPPAHAFVAVAPHVHGTVLGAAHMHHHHHEDAHGHAHVHGGMHDGVHAHEHDHHHAHDGLMHSHEHDHHHAHDGLMHSHGGVMHSHLPPGADGEPVSWRSLLSLGISGGLLPCPSALVLLLAAVALHRTGYGLVLVVAFSLGLAATLTAIGMVFLYARHLLRGSVGTHRLLRYMPAVSAAFITLIGLGICYSAIFPPR